MTNCRWKKCWKILKKRYIGICEPLSLPFPPAFCSGNENALQVPGEGTTLECLAE